MDDLLEGLTGLKTTDPYSEFKDLIENYNTPFDVNNIMTFLTNCQKRYKYYLYNIHFGEFPGLFNNIQYFLANFSPTGNYTLPELEYLFKLTKIIDKAIIDIINED